MKTKKPGDKKNDPIYSNMDRRKHKKKTKKSSPRKRNIHA
jgi:hypothetical protein